jgi:hypothetical protein
MKQGLKGQTRAQRQGDFMQIIANMLLFVGLAYYQGKDIVFEFILEYNSLRDFGPSVIIIGLFLYEDF